MSRRALVPILLLTMLLVAPLVLGANPSRGPFAGVVVEGARQEHSFTNWEDPDLACPAYPWGSRQTYVVTLTYEPAVDRVDLGFVGLRAVGSNGVARLVFEGPNCFASPVYAYGVSTTGPYAAYQVTIQGLNFVRA